MSCFGFLLVVVRCFYSKSVMGISLKSMQCYAVVYGMRLIAIYSSAAYLPFDRFLLWRLVIGLEAGYHAVETTSFICVLVIIYLIMIPFKYTHNIHHVRHFSGND